MIKFCSLGIGDSFEFVFGGKNTLFIKINENQGIEAESKRPHWFAYNTEVRLVNINNNMIKIIRETEDKRVQFSSLNTGVPFEIKNSTNIYIKSNFHDQAFNINNGCIVYFTPDELVTPVNIEIKVLA